MINWQVFQPKKGGVIWLSPPLKYHGHWVNYKIFFSARTNQAQLYRKLVLAPVSSWQFVDSYSSVSAAKDAVQKMHL